ncbi:MAG: response regulator transcription factor [Campylobacterota bacterium]|nr:response regulator transcription factor [Campylobacterota bacterium]
MLKVNSLKNISKNFTILYVEDDIKVSESMTIFFKTFFKEVVTAYNGLDGIELYENYYLKHNNYFDIVISDIRMPKINGVELSKKILSINKEQIVLIFSAYDDSKYLINLINIGVDKFVQKPISPVQITSVLNEICIKLIEKKELDRYIALSEDFEWDKILKILTQNKIKIKLTTNEANLINLFINSPRESYTALEIFEYIHDYRNEYNYSIDSVKSLIKRLRKKLPKDTIIHSPDNGYTLNIT